jgi:hypothetical protein
MAPKTVDWWFLASEIRAAPELARALASLSRRAGRAAVRLGLGSLFHDLKGSDVAADQN